VQNDLPGMHSFLALERGRKKGFGIILETQIIAVEEMIFSYHDGKFLLLQKGIIELSGATAKFRLGGGKCRCH